MLRACRLDEAIARVPKAKGGLIEFSPHLQAVLDALQTRQGPPDLAEVLALSDRVAVLYGGRFAAVLPRAEASEAKLTRRSLRVMVPCAIRLSTKYVPCPAVRYTRG